MRKILFALIFVLLFGINNSFSATISKSWNNNVVNCDSINDNSGQKYIAQTPGWEKSKTGTFTCEKHGYYSGNRYGRYSKNSIRSCPDSRFASKIQWSGSSYRIYCKKRDDTPPTEAEITPNPLNGTYFVAVNNKTLSFTTTPTGSPITEINTTLEKYNNKNSSNSLVFNTSNNFTKYNNNFSVVDTSQSDATLGNYRPYTFHIGIIRDEAGNSTNLNKNYFYNIYANNIDFPGKSTISSTTALSNGNSIANGNINNIQLILKDKYDNRILKVTKADNTIIRNVDVNVNYNNALYLDQYKQSGDSAVYIGTTNLNGTDTPNSGIFRNDSDGIYNLEFKVYSPTTNSYDKVEGSFKVNDVTANISDITGIKTFTSDIEFNFKPIYKIDFVNEGAKKYGFIEGALQDGGITYSKNGTSTTSNENIYLEFGKYNNVTDLNEENTDFDLKLIEPGFTYNIEEGHKFNIGNTTEKTFGNFNFSTKLEQENTSVVNYDLTYFASFIKYDIGGKTIVYPTDIIGKTTYFSGIGTNINNLKGVKILGNTYSENLKNIIKDQEIDYNKINGNFVKSELKKKIRKNAYNLVNNIDLEYYTILNNKYKELLNNKIIYYKLNGGTIKYSDIDNNYKAKDGKTILIIGGDLIIQKNDLKNNSGIHGIVVLKDLKGQGGNILIDDDVLNLNAVMYADKSMLAYDLTTNRYLTLDDGIGYFNNQLYIKGSLFSNNTIGGARGDNLKCAYYDEENCDIKKAQIFDLNFIRRYSRYDSDLDGDIDINDDVANGGSSSVGLENSLKYFNYPLVIEYNPLIQITPPPLFNN